MTIQSQISHNRWINHLLYASPVKRGKGIEVIEDIIPLFNITYEVHVPEMVTRVYLVPQIVDIPFEIKANKLQYHVPRLESHQMVIIDF